MTYQEFNSFCGSLSGASYVKQWGDSDVWKVGAKVFAIGGWQKNDQTAFTFKTSEVNYYFLQEKAGYRPAPYFANRGMKWIQMFDVAQVEEEELRYYISESYKIVRASLSKTKQKGLTFLDMS